MRTFRYLWLTLARRPLLLIVVVAGMVVVGFAANHFAQDYMENDPTFCRQCHVMESAFEAWGDSAHQGINCHECHHATQAAKNRMLFETVFLGPEEVTEPYVKTKGEVNVPFEMCIACHWRHDERYPDAPKINLSMGHALHVYVNEIECASCHASDQLHDFNADSSLCVNCHEQQIDHLHGTQGGDVVVSCLTCHTDTARNIRPDRQHCLSCHVHFGPNPNQPDAPMQFICSTCHKPHQPDAVKPSVDTCLGCHKPIAENPVHALHIEELESCTECHSAHRWTLTEEDVAEICESCHEPRSPTPFYLPHLEVKVSGE